MQAQHHDGVTSSYIQSPVRPSSEPRPLDTHYTQHNVLKLQLLHMVKGDIVAYASVCGEGFQWTERVCTSEGCDKQS